jgi:Xaa-Pro aminopeptidase
MLYWGKFWTIDPFWFLSVGGKTIVMVSILEFGRCLKESRFDEVLLINDVYAKAQQNYPELFSESALRALFKNLCSEYNIDKFWVQPTFPLFAYRQIVEVVPVEIWSGAFCPNRLLKTLEEQKEIRKANEVNARCFALVVELLRQSRVDENGFLLCGGEILTSERVRMLIEMECCRHDASAQRTIVASGAQAADPHCIGYGPILANTLLVVDIFPQLKQSKYYGDMTRTFVKGTPSDAQRRLVDCVLKVQREAIRKVRPGILGSTLHNDVQAAFSAEGYTLVRSADHVEGFIHSLGHGVGLALHEDPKIYGTFPIELQPGMVFTIEPGLYYSDVGGVRFEDVCVVTDDGSALLSDVPCEWWIP